MRVGLVVLRSVAAAGPAAAYRDLAACPDLVPLRPAPAATRADRRCRAAVARAGARWVAQTLGAAARCLAARQQSARTDDATALRRGARHLSTGARIAPADPTTRDAFAAAEAAALALVSGAAA
jgi:hypothetical protein